MQAGSQVGAWAGWLVYRLFWVEVQGCTKIRPVWMSPTHQIECPVTIHAHVHSHSQSHRSPLHPSVICPASLPPRLPPPRQSSSRSMMELKEREFTLEELSAVVKRICKAKTPEARAKLPGLPEKRADVILGGAVLLEEIFLAMGIEVRGGGMEGCEGDVLGVVGAVGTVAVWSPVVRDAACCLHGLILMDQHSVHVGARTCHDEILLCRCSCHRALGSSVGR